MFDILTFMILKLYKTTFETFEWRNWCTFVFYRQ